MEQVRRLSQNGITQKDLDETYEKGHKDGFKAGTDKTLRTIYAGVVLEMLDAGNSKEEAISFLRNLDNRLITSIDAGEDIEEVFNRTGVRLMLKEDFERVREVE
jgi:thermostable 8-oxoguanine DNA glycosylase